MSKVDQTVAAQRVAEISLLRLKGKTVAHCVEYARNKGWEVGYNAVWQYVDKADKAIAKTIERKQTQLIAFGVSQRNRAVEMALEDRDYDAALKLMQDREWLLGLYPEQRPQEPPMQVNNPVVPVLSELQRTALEAALLRRITEAAGGRPEPQKVPSGTALDRTPAIATPPARG
jgi:hypothetical protein